MLNAVVVQKAPRFSFSSCGSSHQDASLPQFYAISLLMVKKTRRSRTFLTNKRKNLMFSVCRSKYAYYIISVMRYQSPNILFRIV